ncbi:hypothetical protein BX666DRAFT_600171 [Dichotomocladium elegans]|nr:hypothetical protein BX666DRAFT_600171 [Dichotomocladium elegans]
MESFLSTLPSYVHDYLNKQPPTDVFNVLRELICFAVLYSNDRERITSKTAQLLERGADKAVPEDNGSDAENNIQGDNQSHGEYVDVVSTRPATISTTETDGNHVQTKSTGREDDEEEETKKPKPRDKSKMLYTFPEWWGHHDGSEEMNDSKKETLCK